MLHRSAGVSKLYVNAVSPPGDCLTWVRMSQRFRGHKASPNDSVSGRVGRGCLLGSLHETLLPDGIRHLGSKMQSVPNLSLL